MFSDNLRKLREYKRLDRKALANILGITYQAVFQYESGVREPSVSLLQKISSFFGVTIDYLINGDDNKNIAKIKFLLKELNYNFKEFADDIGESVFEVEKIVLDNAEPSEQILHAICQKYNIPLSEFASDHDKDLQSFCKSKENKDYIKLAMFIKDNNFEPGFIKQLLELLNSRKQEEASKNG